MSADMGSSPKTVVRRASPPESPGLLACTAPGRVHEMIWALQVIKIGTSSLIREDTNSPNLTSLARVCEVVKELTGQGTTASAVRLVAID